MKKILIAAAALAALPAFATTYNYTALAKGLIGSSQANFTSISINDTAMTLSATVTTTDFTGAKGFTVQCCSPVSTYPVTALTIAGGPITAGTYSYSLDLSSASVWDAGFLAANGGSTSSALSSLLMGINNGVAGVEAWNTASSGLTGAMVAAPVPEPATYAMMALGLGLVALRRRKQAA